MIRSAPPGRVEVLIDALLLLTGDVPRVVEPLVKVTVPVSPLGRVAVNVTD